MPDWWPEDIMYDIAEAIGNDLWEDGIRSDTLLYYRQQHPNYYNDFQWNLIEDALSTRENFEEDYFSLQLDEMNLTNVCYVLIELEEIQDKPKKVLGIKVFPDYKQPFYQMVASRLDDLLFPLTFDPY